MIKHIKTPNLNTIYCTNSECQIEKSEISKSEKKAKDIPKVKKFPSIVKYNTQTYTLFNIGRPTHGDYIILEALTPALEFSRVIHLFTPSIFKNEIKIVCPNLGEGIKF